MHEHDHARLLLAILRGDLRGAEALLPSTPIDPDTFLRLAAECDVQPWLHKVLAEAGRFDLVGAEVEKALSERRTKVRHDNLLLLARTEQALDALAAEGIVPIALKGLDVLHRFYDGFDERTLDDVDLLIPRDRIAAAVAALEKTGWRNLAPSKRDFYLRTSHHLPLPGPGPVPVDFEIHWNLVQEGRFHLDPADLFQRAVPLRIAGRPVLRLDDHDLVAHLLLHHLSHYFDRRLKWTVDLHFVASQPGFDWAVVARRARDWGAKHAAGMSLFHLRSVLPEWIPAQAQAHLPASRWRRALTLPLRSAHPLDLFRNTRRRRVQLLLAAVMYERPWELPRWMLHRLRRGDREELSPLSDQRAPR